MSIYTDELTTKCIVEQASKLKKAFPQLPVEFYDILTDRIKENHFTDKRLVDSVNYVIDNCKYPIPGISDFISFDKKCRLYTYEEMCIKAQRWGKEIWKSYEKIRIKGIVFWYNLSEAQ